MLYLTLEEFCTCTDTYKKYAAKINPYPEQKESLEAIEKLAVRIIDPIIEHFGKDNFCLTYGFCSKDLKRWLNEKDPVTGIKNGRVDPKKDQHMAHEVNRNGKYYCERLGAACDFLIVDEPSEQVVKWLLLEKQLPLDRLYFYGTERPIHVSYGPQHNRYTCTFTASGKPVERKINYWTTLGKVD